MNHIKRDAKAVGCSVVTGPVVRTMVAQGTTLLGY